ncbi:MAG TPA: SAM-dependent methyltransferase [Planctomycetaceae bacterium]|nr:SAM-dependent methyltransferase [Planctomycetaceae bacterium]
MVVDKYDDHLHLSEFERPHDRDLAQHDDWLELMRVSAAEALDVPVSNTFLKRRGMQRGKAQHGRVSQERYEIEVEENGLKFLVNLSDYVDTGLFLDHRETRMMVCNESLDKDVLNLFAYTGSFSVYAADGGAKSTTTVDLSSRYLDWAERNMELNGFTSAAHNYVQSDIREYLSSLPQEELFDLAIVDPPTFSNSKSTEQDWVIQEHYPELLNSVLNRLRPGGIIYFSTNYRRFKFDESFIRGDCREISKQTVPEDFRNKRIHRCWRIEKY